ncbi:MAG TPA: hypothetical protein VIJ60_05405 [Acidimicrobiales bacterium]
MERRIVYLERLTRLPLLGADGADVGRIVDAVVDLGSKPPRINGFVVAVQRRRVFIGINRIGEIGNDGARLRRGSVNLRQFVLRDGERLLAGELIGKRLRNGRHRHRHHAVAREPGLGGGHRGRRRATRARTAAVARRARLVRGGRAVRLRPSR